MQNLTISQRVDAIEKAINYKFRDESLLAGVLQAAGATICTPCQDNKHLALVGDAALRLTIFESEFDREATTCEMTKKYMTHISKKNLAKLGVSLGIGIYIQQYPPLDPLKKPCFIVSEEIIATTMKAIIGAVYLDCGNTSSLEDITRRLILRLPG